MNAPGPIAVVSCRPMIQHIIATERTRPVCRHWRNAPAFFRTSVIPCKPKAPRIRPPLRKRMPMKSKGGRPCSEWKEKIQPSAAISVTATSTASALSDWRVVSAWCTQRFPVRQGRRLGSVPDECPVSVKAGMITPIAFLSKSTQSPMRSYAQAAAFIAGQSGCQPVVSSTTLPVCIDTIAASASRCASSPSAMPASGSAPVFSISTKATISAR